MAGRIYKVEGNYVNLPPNCNQALGIAQFAIDFLKNENNNNEINFEGPEKSVEEKVELFHTDSVFCGLSAISLGTNAPKVLLEEALEYQCENGAYPLGGNVKVKPEKAIVAGCCAVREWDSNGTVFGYRGDLKGHQAGEFGHNDFYPCVIAACQQKNLDGEIAIKAMILLDEIRGRLAEVFSLKSYKIDHVVHGAIASCAVYGALMGATAEQIESSIGMAVAHYIPWRAIRAGHQLSDSKGASAAISTEVAILSVMRSMKGFVGPKDIFRNPESVFRQFEPTENGDSPFELIMAHSGKDFAIMGMHFKLGLYEHQSAGAIQGVLNLLRENPSIIQNGVDGLDKIIIKAYEPAFGIIGDPAKRNPTTRQSADHSMVYIISSIIRKAFHLEAELSKNNEETWKQLILVPDDYRPNAINNAETRKIMTKIEFEHGGEEYDKNYPDGIPTSLIIKTTDNQEFDSGFVMYPAGHARYEDQEEVKSILQNKFKVLGSLAVNNVEEALDKLSNLSSKSSDEIQNLYKFDLLDGGIFDED
eukprot:TRINITY_DN1104_c0_g4_i1.p1 TRINITY_DN1104_c0_g4~~TRINITY_DN1104_c0_g4_i1.p1  ORF type:complete len:532 (-),score=242.46 TRINITY_DN1104_c0_g4_i1:239-1834(-)